MVFSLVGSYLISMTEELDLMIKEPDVHVSVLCPGFTHTEFHAAAGMLEMKNAMPGILWYDAATVVRDGLRAVEKGKVIMISGRLYRWLDPLAQSVFIRPLIKRLAPGR